MPLTAATELITVAVCSIADAGEALERCLAALGVAGAARPAVYRSGRVMSTLRNQALAECRTPVIAFVDDDVVVATDWLEALADAWSKAPPEVACIGGPIEAGVHHDAPRWMTRSLAELTSANTPSARDPAAWATGGTACGGNVSFRADALRGVGGFWPVRGAGRLGDWFSEEHHAQHEMRRSGWKARLDPALAAHRLAGPSARISKLAARQARAGARRRLLGGGETGEAAAALRAASGAVVAAAGLNRALAAERLVRAAGHAGTVMPAAIGARTIAPVAESTPFRHSVPGAGRRPRRRKANGAASILAYHRVTDEQAPAGLAVSCEAFRRQMEEQLERGPAVTLEEAAGARAPRGAFAVTFDDGYADNLHVALPMLEEMAIPATFFITTGHVMSGEHFWWDKVARILSSAEPGHRRGVLTLSVADDRRSWAPVSRRELDETHRHLVAWFQGKPPEQLRGAIRQLASWAQVEPDAATDRPLNPRELLTLAEHPLACVGAHTRTHMNLRFAGERRLEDELEGARSDLWEMTGHETSMVAYPFGIWGADVDDSVILNTRASAYRSGFLNSSYPGAREALATPRRPVASAGLA